MPEDFFDTMDALVAQHKRSKLSHEEMLAAHAAMMRGVYVAQIYRASEKIRAAYTDVRIFRAAMIRFCDKNKLPYGRP